MNHLPFEQWILDDHSLSKDETQLLADHLQQCKDCSRLQDQWKCVEQTLNRAPIMNAPDGFGVRWQSSFLTKKAIQQKSNHKRFINFLIFGSFTSLLMYLTLSVISGSPIRFFIMLLKFGSKLAIQMSNINVFFNSILSYLPPVIPIILWILLSCSLVLMLALWGLTFWRYSIKGVVPNEEFN
jgi:hypothetical protein